MSSGYIISKFGGQWPILSLIECRMKCQPCTQPILLKQIRKLRFNIYIALIKGHALTVVAVKTCKLNCYYKRRKQKWK